MAHNGQRDVSKPLTGSEREARLGIFRRDRLGPLARQPSAATMALSGVMFTAILAGLALFAFSHVSGADAGEADMEPAIADAMATPTELQAEPAVVPTPSPRPTEPALEECPSDGCASQAQVADEEDAVDSGGMAVDCDAATGGIQSSCAYPTGTSFGIRIHVTGPPQSGYFSFQTKLRWTEERLDYDPTASSAVEALWDHCDIPARSSTASSLLFACIPFPPLSAGEASTGAVLSFQFECLTDGSAALELVPRAGDPQDGTHFLDADTNALDPALTSAQVTCGSPPPCPSGGCDGGTPTASTTPRPATTPAATATPTPTAMPTATQTPPEREFCPDNGLISIGPARSLIVSFVLGLSEERALEIIDEVGGVDPRLFPGDFPELGIGLLYEVGIAVGQEDAFRSRFEEYQRSFHFPRLCTGGTAAASSSWFQPRSIDAWIGRETPHRPPRPSTTSADHQIYPAFP